MVFKGFLVRENDSKKTYQTRMPILVHFTNVKLLNKCAHLGTVIA